MKKLLLMFALIMGVVSANAQIAIEKSNALDNISLGVTAGVTTPLDFNSVFPLNTVVGLKAQKDFTPVIGVQIEGLAIFNDNHFGDLKTAFKATNVGLNGVINLSNAFWGYNGSPRTFEVSAVGGIGWLHEFDSKDNSLTAKTGLDLAFNLGKAKAVSIVVSPGVYWNLNRGGKIEFNKHNAQLAVMGSLVYHFKTSNGTHHFKTYDVGAMIDEINRLNEELAKKPNEVVKIVEKKVEVPATDAVSVADKNGETWIVTFATGSAKLTREAKFILNQVGNDAIVNVTATASPDGSAKFNQKLSEKRAKAVADFLTARGVKVNSAEGKGVDSEKGRSAVVKTLQ
jgi:outer membrane protein OmpA-like peptidoglycan-associated protein